MGHVIVMSLHPDRQHIAFWIGARKGKQSLLTSKLGVVLNTQVDPHDAKAELRLGSS